MVIHSIYQAPTGDDAWHAVTASSGGKQATGQAMVPAVKPLSGALRDALVLRSLADTTRYPGKGVPYTAPTGLVLAGQKYVASGVNYVYLPESDDDGTWFYPQARDSKVVMAFSVASPVSQTAKVGLTACCRVLGIWADAKSLTSVATVDSTTETVSSSFTLNPGFNPIVVAIQVDYPTRDPGTGRVRILDDSGSPLSGLSTAVLGASNRLASGLLLLAPAANASYKVGDVMSIDWLAGEEQNEVRTKSMSRFRSTAGETGPPSSTARRSDAMLRDGGRTSGPFPAHSALPEARGSRQYRWLHRVCW